MLFTNGLELYELKYVKRYKGVLVLSFLDFSLYIFFFFTYFEIKCDL